MEKKRIIIEEIDGELAITVLQDGYNIIDYTVYDPEFAKQILDKIEEAKQ